MFITLSYQIVRLLEAVGDSDDPALLIQNASRAHIPIDPNAEKKEVSDEKTQDQSVPDPTARESIEKILEEIGSSEWYRDQIVDRRTFEAKDRKSVV